MVEDFIVFNENYRPNNSEVGPVSQRDMRGRGNRFPFQSLLRGAHAPPRRTHPHLNDFIYEEKAVGEGAVLPRIKRARFLTFPALSPSVRAA